MARGPRSPRHFGYKLPRISLPLISTEHFPSLGLSLSFSLSLSKVEIMALAFSHFVSLGVVVLVLSIVGVMAGSVRTSRFDELFQPMWALDHFAYEGELLKMKLDNYSGNHPFGSSGFC